MFLIEKNLLIFDIDFERQILALLDNLPLANSQSTIISFKNFDFGPKIYLRIWQAVPARLVP